MSTLCSKQIMTTVLVFVLAQTVHAQVTGAYPSPLYQFVPGSSIRWNSPENANGKKGAGGMENNRAKGRPYLAIAPHETISLLTVHAQGIIQRIWVTLSDRSPEMLRALRLDIYWDNEKKPAVSVPFGDFFGVGLGLTSKYQNALFANPEGRSFNCFIPMPFKKAARVTITNESTKNLQAIFFDVDYSILQEWNPQTLYFHAYWHRDTATKLASDFEILPAISGKGRFLGTNIGVHGNAHYTNSWFGEGEVKMYLDGDKDLPTLNGTGTEDYIGTAYGQGQFINNFTGCPVSNDSTRQYCFYRFHIPDPVYFSSSCRVTIQQLGGSLTGNLQKLQMANVPLLPVTTDDGTLHSFYEPGKPFDLNKPNLPKGWTNYYRSDDVSAVSYFYLTTPTNQLPALQDVSYRVLNLK